MRFAVLMRKQNIDNPWVSYRWAPQEVVPDLGQFNSKQSNAISGQFLGRDTEGESWLFTGYELDLFPDEAEGYYLNVSATTPSWFVMWRLEEDIERYVDEQSLAWPKRNLRLQCHIVFALATTKRLACLMAASQLTRFP